MFVPCFVIQLKHHFELAKHIAEQEPAGSLTLIVVSLPNGAFGLCLIATVAFNCTYSYACVRSRARVSVCVCVQQRLRHYLEDTQARAYLYGGNQILTFKAPTEIVTGKVVCENRRLQIIT